MAQLTESIVAFLAGQWPQRPPPAAVDTAVRGFTDCLAVMVAGHGEPVTENLLRFVRARRGPGNCRLLLTEEHSSASLAALAGTASAHALDFDDYAFSNHVSALLVPAIVAEAESTGASGAAMVDAYLAGFETWGTVFKREPDHLHSKGWHPTAVFGALGVAAALCRLRGLDATTCRNALGLAAASGGGLMDNFGTQAKPWQGARAARAGVVAVELAMANIDAGPDALDGSGGLLAALTPAGRVDRDTPASQLGRDWLAAAGSLNIKRHPTVGASQRAIDAAIQLYADYAPVAEAISKVTVRVSEKHAAVMRLHRPTTASEARFSVEFGVAAALLGGRVTLEELSDAFVGRADVQQLIRKVDIETGPDDDPAYPVGARFDTVHLDLADGTRLDSKPVHRFRGHGENPLTPDELKAKFDDCTLPQIGAEQAEALFAAVSRLPELVSAQELPTLRFNAG